MSGITVSGENALLEAQSTNTKLDTLNTNVSKEAKQDTQITALNSIVTNTTGLGLGTTGTQTTVARSATSVTIVASTAGRKQVYIRNDSTVELYLALGATATVGKGIKLNKNDVYIEDKYTGIISGIWASAGAGNAEIVQTT